ncbi:hypothetical protein Tco_1383762 [Tanacetum coccineum]
MPSPSVSTFSFPSTTEPKEEYETWAMKMEYWIMNSDHNYEHIVVQRETKARTILLQSLPEDHMADFTTRCASISVAVKA